MIPITSIKIDVAFFIKSYIIWLRNGSSFRMSFYEDLKSEMTAVVRNARVYIRKNIRTDPLRPHRELGHYLLDAGSFSLNREKVGIMKYIEEIKHFWVKHTKEMIYFLMIYFL